MRDIYIATQNTQIDTVNYFQGLRYVLYNNYFVKSDYLPFLKSYVTQHSSLGKKNLMTECYAGTFKLLMISGF